MYILQDGKQYYTPDKEIETWKSICLGYTSSHKKMFHSNQASRRSLEPWNHNVPCRAAEISMGRPGDRVVAESRKTMSAVLMCRQGAGGGRGFGISFTACSSWSSGMERNGAGCPKSTTVTQMTREIMSTFNSLHITTQHDNFTTSISYMINHDQHELKHRILMNWHLLLHNLLTKLSPLKLTLTLN